MKSKLKRQKFANVWDALEDTPTQAANMTMRSDLLIALRQRIGTWKVTQAQAACRLQVTQPRLNDLLRGRISKFSLDALIDLADRAGIHVRLRIDKAA
jgi:predicted XRE-type DNA-binding protein